MYKHILFLIVLIVCVSNANGQSILLLDQPRKAHKIKYIEKEPIAFRLNNNKQIYSGTLEKIKDSTIVVDNQEYNIHDITQLLDLNKRRGVILFSKVTKIFGAGFLALNTFNNLINAETPVLSDRALKVGLGAIAFGFLLRPFYYKFHAVNKSQPLKILK